MGIGERIREKRKELKITAKELSERSGVPEKTIYRIETSEVIDPKISSIKPIIEVLGCTADDLIMDSKNAGLSGMLKYQFERSDKLPVKEKSLLIQIIDRWVNSVNTEKLYLETLSKEQQGIEEQIEKIEANRFDEIVRDELDGEHYNQLHEQKNR